MNIVKCLVGNLTLFIIQYLETLFSNSFQDVYENLLHNNVISSKRSYSAQRRVFGLIYRDEFMLMTNGRSARLFAPLCDIFVEIFINVTSSKKMATIFEYVMKQGLT